MVKPGQVEDVLARAAQNGYKRGAHKASDQKRGQGKHCPTTREDHARTLQRYVIWRLDEMTEKHADGDLPPPNMDVARAECLRKGVEAPSLAEMKDFFRFYAATSTPQIVEVPTAESLVSVAEWFFPAFTRETGTETSEEDRSEVFSWIRTTLVEEGVVANVSRPKHNFTVVDLNRILLCLWTEDDISWIPERYRVQFTFIFHVYCWTGARLGAFFKGGLLYKDIEIALQREEDGDRWSIIYKLDQRWVKGNRDPENIVFGAAAKEHNRLLYNETAFLVAMAIADGALFGIKTLEDLYEQRLHPGENYPPLRFHASALNRPILRKCSKTGGVSDEKMPQSAFLNIFNKAMLNAGYHCRSSVHAIRRGVGDKVSARYTPVQLAQHITHADTRIFGRSYVANCSSVDGQAAFRGESTDHRHIEYFKGLEKFREKGMPTQLPADLEAELDRDPRLCELLRQLELTDIGDKDTIKQVKNQISYHTKKIQRGALAQFQKKWIQERRDWKVETRGRILPEDNAKTDDFNNICLLIPERGRLAVWMASEEDLPPEQKWHAISDLCSLCTRDATVYYLPNLHPIDGACPAKSCQLKLSSLSNEKRSQHILTCVQRDMANDLQRTQSDINYCYICYNWVVSDEWEPHCRHHLTCLTSKRCGAYTQCYTLVRPASCPFCMGDFTLKPSQRLRSWRRDQKLRRHIRDHVSQVNWPVCCPHPLCSFTIADSRSLEYHFIDCHGMNKSQTTFTDDSPSRASSPEKPPTELEIRYETLETMLTTDEIQPSKKRCLGRTVSPSELLISNRRHTGSPLIPSPLENDQLNDAEMLKDISLPLDDDALFSQFIRSPTLMSETPASDYSGNTLVSKRDSALAIAPPEPKKEDPCEPKPKRIRLLLNSTSDETQSLPPSNRAKSGTVLSPKAASSRKQAPHVRSQQIKRSPVKEARQKKAQSNRTPSSTRALKSGKTSQDTKGKLTIILRVLAR